jgi:predicted ester cyclase
MIPRPLNKCRVLAAAFCFALAAGSLTVTSAVAQTTPGAPTKTGNLSAEAAKVIIAPFYDVLNKPATKNVAEIVPTAVLPEWRSFSGEGVSKTREEFIQQVIGFGKGIPDMAWNIKEVLVAADRVIVRSEATGTPAGVFFGVPHGGKSFKIMAIDIHTVKDGKLVTAYHVEDWATAMRQLSAK